MCVCVCVCEAGTYMPFSLSLSTRYFKPHTLLVGPLLLALCFSFVPQMSSAFTVPKKGSEPDGIDVSGSVGPTVRPTLQTAD